jgi:S-DNA-T family DNA segregation ATPase FtsK/SpoIIIE
MAKRGRKRKSTTKASFNFSPAVTGILLMLIGVIGLGTFGPVGKWIKIGASFLFGNYYYILIIELLLLGIGMLAAGKVPNFFRKRLLGIYFIVFSLLVFGHMNYIQKGVSLSASISNYTNVFNKVVHDNFVGLSQTGGGIIGLLGSSLGVSLVDKVGTYIFLLVFSIIGIVLLLDISMSDVFERMGEMIKESRELSEEDLARREEKKKAKEEKKRLKEEARQAKLAKIKAEEEEEEDENTQEISLDELKKFHVNEVQEEQPAAPIPAAVPLITINSDYKLPDLNEVLNPLKKNKTKNNDELLNATGKALERVLADFQIEGKVVDKHVGPSVTQFEVSIKQGTKVSKITTISKEIALALAAKDVRIEAPIPGKSTVGIELPNQEAVGVPIREVIEAKRKEMEGMNLPVSLGKDIMGNNQIADLSKTPHLLVAGSTGSGKSVCINSFIASLLITKRPDEVKLVLVDPKKVELSNYNGVPHLLCPVVTDPKKASIALQNIVKEMERRYDVFADEKVKNIGGYNEKIANEKKNNPDDNTLQYMPYIVVIVDELADLMLVASKEVEDSIMRITQMARAAGIHLIVATQRPSVDVITGVIKSNIPSRIAFAVASQVDSRTILDVSGAEKLLGKGDMLYRAMGQNTATRIQGNFISDDEIEKVIQYVSHEQEAQYDESITQAPAAESSGGGGYEGGGSGGGDAGDGDDPLYNEIVDFAIQNGKVSASLLQRKFRLGYNRAARVVDLLEERGIIGPQNGSKPREVLVKIHEEEGE